MNSGIVVPDGSGGRTIIKSTISAMIQDEKAHKEFYAVKGASGNSCCAACKNVYYGINMDFAPDEYIGHASVMMPH
eukprot:8091948-Pyramimonas_sp.AAC.1